MRYLFFLTAKYLTRGEKTHISFISFVAMLGLCVGVMALIVVLAVMSGFDNDLKDKMLRLKYHVVIEDVTLDEFPRETMKKIASLERVRSVAPFVEGQVFVRSGRKFYPCVVFGVDFKNKEESSYVGQYLVEGSIVRGSVLVGKPFLENNHVALNEPVTLLSLERKSSEVPISGVFKIGMYEIDSYYTITDIETAKKLLGNGYYGSIGIRLRNIYDAERLKKDILELLPQPYTVRTWAESNSALFSALKLEKITMFIILSLIILVACFNIFATLTVKVVDKIRDIGILHSLGISAPNIVLIFTLQGVFLGITGISLGIVSGTVLCTLIKQYHFVTLPESIYYVKYLPVDLKPGDILIVAGVGLALALIASIIPALRITKIQPAEALRYE